MKTPQPPADTSADRLPPPRAKAPPLARLARLAKRHPGCALRRYEKLARRAREAGQEALSLDVLCAQFQLMERMGRALDLREALGLARQRAAATHLPLQAAGVFEASGRLAYQTGDYFEATAHWSRTVDLAQLVGDIPLGVAARIGLGQIHYALGAWESGRRYHREGQQLLAQADDSYLSAKLALNMGVGFFECKQLAEAEQQFRLGLAEAQRGEHREYIAEAHWQLARTALVQGRNDESTRQCGTALQMAQQLGHAWLQSVALQTWTELAINRQDLPEAVQACQRSLAQAQRIQSRHQESQAHVQMARLMQQQGQTGQALQHLWQHLRLQTEIERQSLPERLGLLAHYDLLRKPPEELLLDLSNKHWQINRSEDVLTAASASGQMVQQIMRLDALHFWWLGEDGEALQLQAWPATAGPVPQLRPGPQGRYLQWLSQRHEPQVMQDLRLHPWFEELQPLIARRWPGERPGEDGFLHAHSRIEIPLFVQERMCGLLWLDQKQARSWTRQDVLQASHAAKLYERLLVALDLALAQRAQAEMAQEKAQLMSRIMASVAHEVNTPIGVAVTAASSLSDSAAALIQALSGDRVSRRELQELAQAMGGNADLVARNLERAAALIGNFKQVAVDQGSEQVQAIHLQAYVQGVLDILRPVLQRARVQTRVDIAPDIQARLAAGPLTQILSNLVMNSLCHAFEAEGGLIQIGAWVQGDSLLLEVADNGRGIAEAMRSRIFDPFFTTKRGQGGSGLGLYIVQSLTQRLGGSVSLPASEQGLCVRLCLPLQASMEE
ncbi:signal transduction histidine kinase [Paucibacter oligotrophus]|uniref:histidine kinase n=1 Tax=Roseateles oligotrophus TaxID=1769250 RepID=A0A840L696_9BURK|nr:ATP-binding protein [Roseateles oligotrophus]MBB4843710.1 signal transduction histidine kinase [Roseateles oligotrophus]